MSYPFYPPFKTRIYECASSSSAAQTLANTVIARCKYQSTLVTVMSTSGGTSGVDIYAWPNILASGAITGAPASVTFTSGGSITTSTGNASFLFTTTSSAPYLNQGDQICVEASTGVSGPRGFNVVHTVQEF